MCPSALYVEFTNSSKEANAVYPKSLCKPRPHTRQMDMQLELYVIGYVLEHQGIYFCRKIQDALGVQVSDL